MPSVRTAEHFTTMPGKHSYFSLVTHERNLLRASRTGFLSWQQQKVSSLPSRQWWLWGPRTLPSYQTRRLLSPRQNSRNTKQDSSMLSLQIPIRIIPWRLNCVHIKLKMLLTFAGIFTCCQYCWQYNIWLLRPHQQTEFLNVLNKSKMLVQENSGSKHIFSTYKRVFKVSFPFVYYFFPKLHQEKFNFLVDFCPFHHQRTANFKRCIIVFYFSFFYHIFAVPLCITRRAQFS